MQLPSLAEHQQRVEQAITELRDCDAAVNSAEDRIESLSNMLATARERLETVGSARASCEEDDIPCKQHAEQDVEKANSVIDRLEKERRQAEEDKRAAQRALQQALMRCEDLARELDADLRRANEQVAHFNSKLATVHSADLVENLKRQGQEAQAAAEGLAELVNRLYDEVASLRHCENAGVGGGVAATVLGLLGATLGFASAGLSGGMLGGLAGLVFGKAAFSSSETSCSGPADRPVAKAARMDFALSAPPSMSNDDRGMKLPFKTIETDGHDSGANSCATSLTGSFLDNGMNGWTTGFAASTGVTSDALMIQPSPPPPSLEAMQAPLVSTFGEKPLVSTFGDTLMDSLAYTPGTLGSTLSSSPATLGSTLSPPPATLGSALSASPVTLGSALSASPATLGGAMPTSPVTLGGAAPSIQPVTLGGAPPSFGGSSF